ncbi:MAG: universal stress protein [Chitinophagaceae bacterium]|jgi:nucleotide-binding universal stress UspA family protein|nr:universal stress protein [Chitinophagaceae bacterium]
MNAILVPTDFSDTAKNAGLYAVSLACEFGIQKIILYNAYQAPMSADPSMPSVQLFDIDILKKTSEEGLEQFEAELRSSCTKPILFERKAEFQLLTSGVEELCKQFPIDAIVMGITGGSKVEEVLIGSNTISVAKHVTVPVFIIPQNARYQPIRQVVLACDFKKVVETMPVAAIKNLLDLATPKLHILNVTEKPSKADEKFESLLLDTLFQGYTPQYHFVHDTHFTEAINQFADNNNIDLIITIPKKHGLFEGLFRKSHTKALAFHSHVPLMIIHE